METLRRDFAARTRPMLAEMQAAADAEIRQGLGEERAAQGNDSLTNLGILRREAARFERRWQDQVDARFAGWPHSAGITTRLDAYALVSEDELQAQLIGQPVIEAMERRFLDVLDVIDSRLWSLAAGLGAARRPSNPFAPRALVEAVLATFPVADCDPDLRQSLLRQYERIAGARLGPVYAWLNTRLAEAGHALASNGDFAALVTQPAAVVRDGVEGGRWADDNALQPRQSSWRGEAMPDAASGDAGRGHALRTAMRAARADVDAAADGRRAISDTEFLSVLSLLQGSETPAAPVAVDGSFRTHLQETLVAGAASLGMAREQSRLSAGQQDAIDLVGRLFDDLRAGARLSPAADARLGRLAYPLLRLAFDDQGLFDAEEPVAFQVLDALVGLWDGNQGASEVELELHAIANRVADRLANEYHGDVEAFTRAHQALEAASEPLRRRADIAERRAWQSILGRERLQAARAEGDRQLALRLDGRSMLPKVAEFLADPWWQALVHAWLREGEDSARLRSVLDVGDAILRVDDAAAHAQGRAVADGLIALERPLRECFVTSGLDESGANELLAGLVGELARPDAPRIVPDHVPNGPPVIPQAGSPADPPLSVGQVAIVESGGVAQWSRVAWISPLSGQVLLVNRQGARVAQLSGVEAAAQCAAGTLQPRPGGSPVHRALAELAPR